MSCGNNDGEGERYNTGGGYQPYGAQRDQYGSGQGQQGDRDRGGSQYAPGGGNYRGGGGGGGGYGGNQLNNSRNDGGFGGNNHTGAYGGNSGNAGNFGDSGYNRGFLSNVPSSGTGGDSHRPPLPTPPGLGVRLIPVPEEAYRTVPSNRDEGSESAMRHSSHSFAPPPLAYSLPSQSTGTGSRVLSAPHRLVTPSSCSNRRTIQSAITGSTRGTAGTTQMTGKETKEGGSISILASGAPSRPETPVTRQSGETGNSSGQQTTSSDPINVAEQLEALQLTSFYVRPGFGKEGRPIQVVSNHFAVRAAGGRGRLIYHYDVDMVPVVKATKQKLPRGLLRAVWEQFVLDHSQSEWASCIEASAFDGRRNVFSPIKLPIPDGDTIHLQTALNSNRDVSRPKREGSSSDEEQRRWKLAFKLVAKIDLEFVMEFCRADKNTPHSEEASLTGIMCTNVLLRDFPSKRYAQVGSSGNKFFTLEGARPIAQGAVVCRGFLQSFRHSNSGFPLINIDLGFSAFLSSGPGLDVVARILGKGPGGMRGGGNPRPQDFDSLTEVQIGILKRKLRGAKFFVTHRQSTRLHTVITVTLKPACDIVFELDGQDGRPRKINVPDYYFEYYGTAVRKPGMPCIQYGKHAYVPLEFVKFDDFNSLPPTNLTTEQTADMIKVAAIKPRERAAAVMAWRKELNYENQKKIAAWGLQVNQNMVEINARVLSSPDIQYRNTTTRVENGQWRLRGSRFVRDVNRPLINWAVISFDRFCDTSDMQRWVNFLCGRLERFGLNVGNRQPALIPPCDPRNPENLIGSLQRAARAAFMVDKNTPQLILIILPGKDAWLYETIKRLVFTELKVPVATQCMQSAKIKNERGIDAYADNLTMKIAAKLGGLSHSIPPNQLPGIIPGRTMILGAGLGHPPVRPGQECLDPTVACSIATYNGECNAYSAQIRLQEGRGDVIIDLSNMVEEHLHSFAQHNKGEYPERILLFRDGISEGQYSAVTQYEHDAITKACARITPTYRPRILICVCAKRHTTRFFAKSDQDADRRTGNLPAGLVVDRTVTHPYAFDFFLQAHGGLVGTARPTHYICLLDELAMTPDQLQKLVHSLCHSFARCTSSVSLVPVCYMADLVCKKTRVIVQKRQDGTTPSITSITRTNVPGGRKFDTASQISKFSDRWDVHQLQKLLSLNPELSQVGWWM